VPGREAEMLALRRHAAMTGMWTRELARHRRRNVEAAFLSGLMHDVGKPILLQAVLELASGSPLDETTLRTWIDELHAAVGARLLERWNLPPWVSAAVAGHHFPGLAGSHRELAATVLLGDLFAHACDDPTGEKERELRRHHILGELGIYPDDLEQLFARKSAIQSSAQSFA
jgi:putative nucleotidyltransferase with HDIG domain